MTPNALSILLPVSDSETDSDSVENEFRGDLKRIRGSLDVFFSFFMFFLSFFFQTPIAAKLAIFHSFHFSNAVFFFVLLANIVFLT